MLFLAEGGEPLSKSGLDTAWQRLVHLAMHEGVLASEDRFSHVKRKGGTDAVGNAEKQGVLGVSAAMMKAYDTRCRRETIGVINGAIYGGAVGLRASRCCDGGPTRTRTWNQRIMSPLL